MKNIEELRGLTIEELNEKLTEAVEEYENLKIQKATHQLTNPIRIRYVRREIARIKTLVSQQEMGIASNTSETK